MAVEDGPAGVGPEESKQDWREGHQEGRFKNWNDIGPELGAVGIQLAKSRLRRSCTFSYLLGLVLVDLVEGYRMGGGRRRW
jgi:hypothetical protein